MPDGEVELKRRLPEHYVDTFDVGWQAAVAEMLLLGKTVALYDWPTEQWVMLRPAVFREGSVLEKLRKILRDDFGIVARRQGRRR